MRSRPDSVVLCYVESTAVEACKRHETHRLQNVSVAISRLIRCVMRI
jgi:hypothetical protein